jgi:hypothetical protein
MSTRVMPHSRRKYTEFSHHSHSLRSGLRQVDRFKPLNAPYIVERNLFEKADSAGQRHDNNYIVFH